jgi:hypothetical protein
MPETAKETANKPESTTDNPNRSGGWSPAMTSLTNPKPAKMKNTASRKIS